MPFESKAEARFMFAKHPEIAKRFAAETPNFASLPQYVHPHRQMSPRQRVAVAIMLAKKNGGT